MKKFFGFMMEMFSAMGKGFEASNMPPSKMAGMFGYKYMMFS